MMRYIIPLALLLMLTGTAFGTMWLYDDPTFFQIGSQAREATFQPGNISVFEIINSPYFPLLGQGFYMNAIPVKLSNGTDAIQIGKTGGSTMGPIPVTFSGHLENNMKYAMSKSSLRVGSEGSWSNLGA
jgi:hypothetical protein